MTVSTMEPGELLLMQMKAKFPNPKKKTKKPKTKKTKVDGEESRRKTEPVEKKEKKKKKTKSTKKIKKEKKIIIEDDVLSNQSDSSGSQPQSRSTDSGNVSDSNSSNTDNDVIRTESDVIPDASLTSIDSEVASVPEVEDVQEEEELVQPPKKLSNRVAFFEQAIVKASTTKRRNSLEKISQKSSSKRDAFLKAVSTEEQVKKEPPKISNVVEKAKKSVLESTETKKVEKVNVEEDLYEADSEIYEMTDPLDEEPKFGMLFFTPRDIRMEKKLIKKLASSIEENGVQEVRPMLEKKLKNDEKIRIGVIGDSMSGKSSLIKALGGDVSALVNKYTGRVQSCYQPTNVQSSLGDNVVYTELPGITESGRYSAEKYSQTVDLDDFDVLIMLTATWFKSNHAKLMSNYDFIYARTKIDDSVSNDRNRRGEAAVMEKVRKHCEESLGHNNISLITTKQMNTFDGTTLIRQLLNTVQGKRLDALVSGLRPVCLEMIQRKRDILASRIWKVAAISTVSGVMPIPGFNLTADIELLKTEIKLYRAQFDISDDILQNSSNCPEMVQVWEVITHGDGLLSLLRQSAMDQEWEEFSKFMNKLPLIGGNVSFAATCSVLKYCLNELCSISIRQNDMTSRSLL